VIRKFLREPVDAFPSLPTRRLLTVGREWKGKAGHVKEEDITARQFLETWKM
jgi:hypothetical protein